ncbi:hypothetical protein [Tsukamurella paurometabola]|uniref:Uncharacterized protein n=1 Tax=Tsukamurella paurometabola TaxID=2061 RepID=A0ABS5NES5_TSUPA|nr:hypothetical protein [Tsukamurella paurometabola]MBS4102784.1 hypothetical protein [Tsukamurella paurometabola]
MTKDQITVPTVRQLQAAYAAVPKGPLTRPEVREARRELARTIRCIRTVFPATTVASLLDVTAAEGLRLTRDVLPEDTVEALTSIYQTRELPMFGAAVDMCMVQGWTYRDIAAVVGLTKRRVMYAHQIREDKEVHVPGLARRKAPPPKPGTVPMVGPLDAA